MRHRSLPFLLTPIANPITDEEIRFDIYINFHARANNSLKVKKVLQYVVIL